MSWFKIGATVISVVASSKASKAAGKASAAQSQAALSAAQIQADSEAKALKAMQEQYQETKGILMPFVTPGSQANQLQAALSGALGPEAQQQAYDNYQEGPGVEWAREQGMRGIEAELASTGRGGGARLKAISRFNQGLALQDFGNSFNRLGVVTSTGLSAAQAIGGIGSANAAGQANTIMQSGVGQANAMTQMGQAQAGGILGRAQAFTQGAGQLSQLYGMYRGSQ